MIASFIVSTDKNNNANVFFLLDRLDMNSTADCMVTYLREIKTNVVIVRNFRSRLCLDIIQ